MWLIVGLHHWFTNLREYKVLSHVALHAGQETISDDHFHLIFLVNNFQSWSSWTISMVMHEPCGQRNRCFGGRTQETPEVIMSS